jgi:hypothetical protein
MSHEKLKWMKDSLICVVENELCNLGEVDTKELGEAIDMIKDLEEAIYYATVTEAMNKPEKEWEMKKSDHHQNIDDDRMYYDEPMWRDEYGGRSPMSRKMYMEAKHMNKDKATQLRELEKYMQELSQDITEMIADASPEEKQYLEKKITALASKIGSMK